jgi:hypothetical protein
MSERAVEQWLPINFIFSRTSVSVRWMDFGSKLLAEPLFQQTLDALRSLSTPARERVTDLSTFLTVAGSRQSVRPSGVIFHISRCGSTLVANSLRTGDGVVALAEAGPLGVWFALSSRREVPFPAETWQETLRTMANAVVTLYAHHGTPCNPKVVVKCHAITTLQISQVRAIWPDVPFLILIRDPTEVIVSNLERPGGWVGSRHEPLGVRNMFGWTGAEIESMPLEEYCARGVGRFCEAAVAHIDHNCRVADYTQLVGNLHKIARFFNLEIAPVDSCQFKHVLETYAKDSTWSRTFQSDDDRKRRETTIQMREAVLKWAAEPYNRLRQHAVW